MHKRGLCRRGVSVCPSVCSWHSWILSKRINISSNFFHHRVATPYSSFFHTERHSNIPTRTAPNGVVECRILSDWLAIDRWLLKCEKQLWPSIVQFTAHTATHQWIYNRKLRLTYIEANYWQTRSIARPLCDSMTTYFYLAPAIAAMCCFPSAAFVTVEVC